MRKHMIVVDGRSIEVIESVGQGDPLILFHGNSSAASSYMPLINGSLGKARKLVAVSFPGHGDSDRLASEDEDCSFQNLGKFAARAVAVLGYKRYWLLGQSLGGHAILESLDDFPGVRGIVLVSSPPISSATLGEVFKPEPSGGLLFKGNMTEHEVNQLASCFFYQADEQSRTLLKDCIKKTDTRFRPALGKSLKNGEIKDELSAVIANDVPVVLLAGTNDKFLRNDFYGKLPMNRFWKKEVVWFKNCGHALNLENPEMFQRTVAEFIGAAV